MRIFYCMAICNISQFSKSRQNESGIKLLYSRIPWINSWTGKNRRRNGLQFSMLVTFRTNLILVRWISLFGIFFYLMTMLFLSWQRLEMLYQTVVCVPLLWRHNGRDGVSNLQPQLCLINRLCGHRSKKTSKLRVTGLCAVNLPVTGEFPTQRASDAEKMFACDDVIM